MSANWIGWDIGGAHVKAARCLDGGRLRVAQHACPLWQGVDQLRAVLPTIVAELGNDATTCHAVTMTGELVDAFADRSAGVAAIAAVLTEYLGHSTHFFAGPHGWLRAAQLRDSDHARWVASANWLAGAQWLAQAMPAALWIDIGSTTSDLLIVRDGQVRYRGYDDQARMQHGELVYTGVVRTPLFALTASAPWEGMMQPLAAEHFATSADVYRVLGDLADYADAWPSADGAAKTAAGSARRLARQLGCDLTDATEWPRWRATAQYFAACQLHTLLGAALRQESRGLLPADAPVVGAGVGRFVAARLAQQLGRPYHDMTAWLGSTDGDSALDPADLAPAVAVAKLAEQRKP